MKKDERFFGLNCLDSVVFANGIKASTFEKLHWLPATWMSVAGRIVGIEHASNIGDYLASIAYWTGML